MPKNVGWTHTASAERGCGGQNPQQGRLTCRAFGRSTETAKSPISTQFANWRVKPTAHPSPFKKNSLDLYKSREQPLAKAGRHDWALTALSA